MTDVRFESREPWLESRDAQPGEPAKGSSASHTQKHWRFRTGFVSERRHERGRIAPLWPSVKPEYRTILEAAEIAFAEMTTQKFRDDAFRHLGPTWCVYASPSVRRDAEGSADPAFLIEVQDSERAGKLLDEMVSRANAYFLRQRPDDGGPAIAFERLPAPERGYHLVSPAGAVPWLSDQLEPTVLLGKSYFAVAANPALARRSPTRGEPFRADWRACQNRSIVCRISSVS